MEIESWLSTTIIVAAGILTCLNLGDKLVAWVREVKKPQTDLEARVVKIENKMELEYKALFQEYEIRFKNDLTRLDEIENSNKLTQKALVELMRHAVDGNNTEKLKKVAEELNDYILNK